MRKTPLLILFLVCYTALSYSQTKNKDILAYIEKYHELAIREMKEYKIPASITLAQGIFESGWGKSKLATKSNNHFGIKCKSYWKGGKVYHDDDELQECFRKYDSVEDSYEDHSKFLVENQRYAALFKLDKKDYKGWAKGLKKAGYATNPIYASKLIDMIELYELHQYDDPTRAEKKKDEKKIKEQPAVVEKPVLVVEKLPKIDERVSSTKKGRTIYVHNKCKYIKVEDGDTWEIISTITGKKVSKLYDYNEVTDPLAPLENGAFIYLSKKKKRSSFEGEEFVVTSQLNTIYKISQYFGIQVDILSESNSLIKNEELEVGKKIILK